MISQKIKKIGERDHILYQNAIPKVLRKLGVYDQTGELEFTMYSMTA